MGDCTTVSTANERCGSGIGPAEEKKITALVKKAVS